MQSPVLAEDINEKGKVTKRLFPKYGDFHIWAIKPAVKEINLMTDLKISYVEQKTPGTKRVEALLFRIAPNARCDQLLAPIPGSAGKVSSEQPELFGQQDESEKYLEEVQGRFKLSAPQIKGVRSIVAARGMGYLKEKDAVVMRMRPDNAARALLAALRDDWQPPVEIKKRPGLKNQTADAVVNNISPEEAREAARALRGFERLWRDPVPAQRDVFGSPPTGTPCWRAASLTGPGTPQPQNVRQSNENPFDCRSALPTPLVPVD